MRLSSSITKETLVDKSDERLALVLSELEKCRAVLMDSDPESAALISVVILELQTKLNRISDVELQALCDSMSPDPVPVNELQASPQRRPPLLKLVT